MEVWNPGKLHQGMTIAKLNKEHTANHVNPVLAHPITLLAISSKWEQELLILSTIVWSMDFASRNSTKMMIFELLYGKEGGVIVGVQERGQEESLYYFFIVSQTPASYNSFSNISILSSFSLPAFNKFRFCFSQFSI